MTEAERFAFVDLDGMQGIAQDLLREMAGGERPQLLVEGQNQGEVDAGLGEQLELARQRRDQGGALRFVENMGGVWVEGDHHGTSLQRLSTRTDRGDHALMAHMNTIEVADCDHGRPIGTS